MKTFYTFLLMLSGLYTHACTCLGNPEDSHGEINLEWMSKFPLVFTAHIDSVTAPPVDSHGMPLSWEHAAEDVYVTVQTVYKGALPLHLTINPPHYFSSCADRLADDVGKTFLFFGIYFGDGTIGTHYCYGSQRLYSERELDTLIGPWKKEYRSLISLLNTWNSTKNGYLSIRYMNGRTMGGGNMKNGCPDGSWEHYNYYGHLTSKGAFIGGLKSGVWLERRYWEFYSSKTKRETAGLMEEHRGDYLNGQRTGVWTEYQYTTIEKTIRGRKRLVKKAYPVARGTYVAGVQEGTWIELDEDGNVTKTTVYHDGREVK